MNSNFEYIKRGKYKLDSTLQYQENLSLIFKLLRKWRDISRKAKQSQKDKNRTNDNYGYKETNRN